MAGAVRALVQQQGLRSTGDDQSDRISRADHRQTARRSRFWAEKAAVAVAADAHAAGGRRSEPAAAPAPVPIAVPVPPRSRHGTSARARRHARSRSRMRVRLAPRAMGRWASVEPDTVLAGRGESAWTVGPRIRRLCVGDRARPPVDGGCSAGVTRRMVLVTYRVCVDGMDGMGRNARAVESRGGSSRAALAAIIWAWHRARATSFPCRPGPGGTRWRHATVLSGAASWDAFGSRSGGCERAQNYRDTSRTTSWASD